MLPCQRCHVLTENRSLLVSRAITFIFTAFTGIRPTRLPFGLIETVLEMSFYPLFLSAFLGGGLYFLVEIVYMHVYDEWLETHTTYPNDVIEVPCAILSIYDTIAPIFFEWTNHPLSIDLLLALDGMYWSILNYRFRLRSFQQLIYPKLNEMCVGGLQQSRLHTSVIAMIGVMLIGFVVTIIPLHCFVMVVD